MCDQVVVATEDSANGDDHKGRGEGRKEGDNERFVLFPIQRPILWRGYKILLASFWTVEEVDLSVDLKDWSLLTPGERTFIEHVLAAFANGDMVVMENLMQNFMRDVDIPEAKFFYAGQLQQESIHSEMYSLMISEFVHDPKRQSELFNAIHKMPAIKAKGDWACQWMDSKRPFVERIMAFACVEGIGFSASFCAIYWFKSRNKMPGLCFSNELIARDEGMHTDFAVALFHECNGTTLVSQQTAHAMIESAVECERNFVRDALPLGLLGMAASSMSQYVEFVADRLLLNLGYQALYKVECPFDWMQLISLKGRTNFFERRVGDYQRANVMSKERQRASNSISANPPPAPLHPHLVGPTHPAPFPQPLPAAAGLPQAVPPSPPPPQPHQAHQPPTVAASAAMAAAAESSGPVLPRTGAPINAAIADDFVSDFVE